MSKGKKKKSFSILLQVQVVVLCRWLLQLVKFEICIMFKRFAQGLLFSGAMIVHIWESSPIKCVKL